MLHGVGEPMLVKDLPRMVRYLKDRGTYVLFNTNGTVLNDRNGRALIDAGLDELRVSLDASTRESYLAVRGVDYFERILENVRRFRAMQEREGLAKPRVSAWLTGLKETVAELPAFVRLAAEIGVREVYLQRLVFFETGAVGKARPDQALFESLAAEEAEHLREAERLAAALGPDLLGLGRRLRARPEPGARGGREPVVALRPALDRDVFHRQRPRPALLHRALRPGRLRELHARRRHAGDAGARSGTAPATATSARPSSPTGRPPPAPTAACAGASEPLRAVHAMHAMQRAVRA